MPDNKIKAWYGVDDQFHLSIKVNGVEYAVCGSEGADIKILVDTLLDLVTADQLGFTRMNLYMRAFSATIKEHNNEHGFETHTHTETELH